MSKYSQDDIIDYLEGNMNPAKFLKFENSIIIDKSLAKDINKWKQLLEALTQNNIFNQEGLDSSDLELLEKLNNKYQLQVSEEYFAKKRSNRLFKTKSILFVISVVAASILLFIFPPISQEETLDSFLTYELNLFSDQNRGGDELKMLNTASLAFKNEEFSGLIKELDLLIKTHNTLKSSMLIEIESTIAYSYLKKNKFKEGISILKLLIDKGNPKAYPSFYYAKYLLAWSYLRTDENYQLAKKYLQELKEQQQYSPAIKLLDYTEQG